MKRCPECRRDYFDDSLLYCLVEGSALLEGPAAPLLPEEGWPKAGVVGVDEPATAILSEQPAAAEDAAAGSRRFKFLARSSGTELGGRGSPAN